MGNKISKITIAVIFINLLALLYSFIACVGNGVFDRLFGDRYMRDEYWMVFFFFITSFINLCFSFLTRKIDGENLIYLIIKRRRLEEQKRIRDLESKI